MEKIRYHYVLTIAGFDGSGGAGIQADLKTFSALGCYGLSVLTALPIQNTLGVHSVYEIPESCIADQLFAIFDSFDIRVIKIGMLHTSTAVQTVVNFLKKHSHLKIVLDPVMSSKNGHSLLAMDAIELMSKSLFPLATVITPNVPEAEVLLGRVIRDRQEVEQAAFDLTLLGPKAVVIKGGHLLGESSHDCLCIHQYAPEIHWFSSLRVDTKNTHGTGCTFSAAIAAYLSKGNEIIQSVEMAKCYVFSCLRAGASYHVDGAHGPLHHSFASW